MQIRRALDRTGDRDTYISLIMYQAQNVWDYLRSVDYDALPWFYPTILCSRCCHPYALFEATRAVLVPKDVRYTAALAELVGCPAFVLNHNGKMGARLDGADRKSASLFTLIAAETGDELSFIGTDPEQEFVDWMESLAAAHAKKGCARFRKIQPR